MFGAFDDELPGALLDERQKNERKAAAEMPFPGVEQSLLASD